MKKFIVSILFCLAICHLALRTDIIHFIDEVFDDGTDISEYDVEYELSELSDAENMIVDVVPLLSAASQRDFAQNLGETKPPEETAKFTGELEIRNDSSMELDIDMLMSERPVLSSVIGEPQVLIIHTHGSEAYTQTRGDNYVESDPYRTEDKSHNVIKVGDVLTQVFEDKGIGVIHDRELYDSPSYAGSYTRSGNAVEEYLRKYPSIAVVIDLHRDAIGSGDTVYKTRAEPALGNCAQVMLLVGTGENGLYHPNWKENMKLALLIQQAMEEKYPSLARPLAVKSERYNQHLSTGAMIVEVGSTGNSLLEAVTAISLFGDAAGDVLKSILIFE